MSSTQAQAFAAARPRPAELAWRQMLRTLGLAERVMQPHFARFGITGSQWGVLRNLHRAELEGHAALRLTDLSERLLIRPPSVTGVVDRLQRAGLVVRKGSPTDLRAKRVSLTQAGRHLVEQVLTVHSAQIDAVLAGLAASEGGGLQPVLDGVGQHLERWLMRECTGSFSRGAKVETN